MNESQLELSVMELFGQEGYQYINGERLLRETTDVLLKDDLKAYLLSRYSKDGLTQTEAESIILSLVRASHDPLYEVNRQMLHKITEGFILRREDKSKKDLFIRLIDCENVENNIFKVVNQFEVQGMECLRIPDAIVFINGLPLVVIEFKSATRENATIFNAYEQLTVRYTRDIPDLFKYNAFVRIFVGKLQHERNLNKMLGIFRRDEASLHPRQNRIAAIGVVFKSARPVQLADFIFIVTRYPNLKAKILICVLCHNLCVYYNIQFAEARISCKNTFAYSVLACGM